MSLLQIAEPGMSTAPHQERFAVGIDLGTTNSLAATVRNGSPEVLVDEKNQKLLPSVVHYEKNGDVVVGEEARLRAEADPLYHFQRQTPDGPKCFRTSEQSLHAL